MSELDDYYVVAELRTPRDVFEALNVETALESHREEVISRETDSVTFRVNRRVKATDADEAEQKARNGKLLTDVQHEVKEIEEVRATKLL